VDVYSNFDKNLLAIRPLVTDTKGCSFKVKTYRGGNPVYLTSLKEGGLSAEDLVITRESEMSTGHNDSRDSKIPELKSSLFRNSHKV